MSQDSAREEATVLNSFFREDPVRKRRELLDEIDCDIRTMVMRLSVLRKAMQNIEDARTVLEERRREHLCSLNGMLSRRRTERSFPYLPPEIVRPIWEIYTKCCYRVPAASLSTTRHLHTDADLITEERDLLGAEPHSNRPIYIDLPYPADYLLEDDLEKIANCAPSPLCVDFSADQRAQPHDNSKYQELDRCLSFSSQWEGLTMRVKNVSSMHEVLVRCSAALPYIQWLVVGESTYSFSNFTGDIRYCFPYAKNLRLANISSNVLSPLRHLIINLTLLNLSVITVKKAKDFCEDVIPCLPRTLQTLRLTGLQRLTDKSKDLHAAISQADFPGFKTLVLDGAERIAILKPWLKIFHATQVRSLVLGQKMFVRDLTEASMDDVRSLVTIIDKVFPTLSELIFSAASIQDAAESNSEDLAPSVTFP